MTRVHVSPRAFEPPLAPTWAGLWSMTQRRLRSLGYQPGTLRVYRATLRGLARSSNETPDRIKRRHLDFYLRRLAMRRRSAYGTPTGQAAGASVRRRHCAPAGARGGP